MKASPLIRGAWTTVCWGQTAPCWNCRGIIGTAEQTVFCKKAEQLLPAAELYRRTGTQVMEINTLFQLLCQRDSGGFDQCATILPMPDLFAYLLTGTISAERSIASTTQMLSAETGTWDRELLELFHIPHRILPEIVESGTAKGTLSPEVQQRLGLPAICVTAVCGHDTQCAAFAAPAKTDKHVFLSCGTWSLFGTEPEQPVLTEQAAALGLSNEVGYGKRVTFLKNIIGLWLLQESVGICPSGKELQLCGDRNHGTAEPRTVQLYRSGRSGLCAPRGYSPSG